MDSVTLFYLYSSSVTQRWYITIIIMSFCFPRRGNGHHLCQSGQPRDVAVWRESALWTFRTASDRKPADASWLPNEQLLSDRTQPQRGRTASRSTSLKPRHGFEVHGFILSPPFFLSTLYHHPTPARGATSSLLLLSSSVCSIICCHFLGFLYWSYTRQDLSHPFFFLKSPYMTMWHCHREEHPIFPERDVRWVSFPQDVINKTFNMKPQHWKENWTHQR